MKVIIRANQAMNPFESCSTSAPSAAVNTRAPFHPSSIERPTEGETFFRPQRQRHWPGPGTEIGTFYFPAAYRTTTRSSHCTLTMFDRRVTIRRDEWRFDEIDPTMTIRDGFAAWRPNVRRANGVRKDAQAAVKEMEVTQKHMPPTAAEWSNGSGASDGGESSCATAVRFPQIAYVPRTPLPPLIIMIFSSFIKRSWSRRPCYERVRGQRLLSACSCCRLKCITKTTIARYESLEGSLFFFIFFLPFGCFLVVILS